MYTPTTVSEYPVIVTTDDWAFAKKEKKSSTGRQFKLDPTIDASVVLSDKAFALFVVAQRIAPGKEISGFGFIKDGELTWAGFTESGTAASVTNTSARSAKLMARCLQETGGVPNVQVHTHPGMTCFWSGTDLNSQHVIIDEAADVAKEGDMYFIVFSAHPDGFGVKYALSRRVVWANEDFRFNDGEVSFSGVDFTPSEKGSATGAPQQQASVNQYQSTSVQKHQKAGTSQYKQASWDTGGYSSRSTTQTRISSSVDKSEPFFPSASSRMVYDDIVAGNINLNDDVYPSDVFAAFYQADKRHTKGMASWTVGSVLDELDRAETLQDVYLALASPCQLGEAIGYCRYITERPKNPLYSRVKFAQCFTAYVSTQEQKLEVAQQYILLNDLDAHFCDMLDGDELGEFFPERKAYTDQAIAVMLAKAINGASFPEKAHWLWKELKKYNGWFAEQVFGLIPPSVKGHAGRPAAVKSDRAEYALNVICNETSTSREILNSAATLRWNEVLWLKDQKEQCERLKTMFSLLVNGLMFGEVWLDMLYAQVEGYSHRAKNILESIKDLQEYTDFAEKVEGKSESV